MVEKSDIDIIIECFEKIRALATNTMKIDLLEIRSLCTKGLMQAETIKEEAIKLLNSMEK